MATRKASPVCGASRKSGRGVCRGKAIRQPDGSWGRCRYHGGQFDRQKHGPPKHGLYADQIRDEALLDAYLSAEVGRIDQEIKFAKAMLARAVNKAETHEDGWDGLVPRGGNQFTAARPEGTYPSITWRMVIEEYTDRIARLERTRAEIESKGDSDPGRPVAITINVVRPVGLED